MENTPFAPAPAPVSSLARYRLLGANCGLRVSPLCIGGMSFGDAWAGLLGSATKSQIFELLDYYRSQGGNFIDLANCYQDEQSEIWVGEWMESRECRDEMVIATKFTLNHRNHGATKPGGPKGTIAVNYAGNGAKSMRTSLAASLKKLRTTYIDLFYIHTWYYDTPIPEVMHHLNDLVSRGQILYPAISNAPAWVVSQANQYARDHALRPFVAYQGRYSPVHRELEREVVPMAVHEGMALASWGVMGQGAFREEDKTATPQPGAERPVMIMPNQQQAFAAARDVLKEIAAAHTRANGKAVVNMYAVLIAYARQKAPHSFPIVGMRSVASLQSCIDALEVQLGADEIARIDAACPLEPGWPNNFLLAPGLEGAWVKGPHDLWASRMDGEVVVGGY